jgi:hypothetical protein
LRGTTDTHGCYAGYEDKDLQLLAGFLRQTADAARTAAEKLTTD